MRKNNPKSGIYQASGYYMPASPADGKKFGLKELQKIVGGTIDIKRLPKDRLVMVLNDEGMLLGLPENKEATKIWHRNYPLKEFPYNNPDFLVGDVLVCSQRMVR